MSDPMGAPNFGGLASFTAWWKENAGGLASTQGTYYKNKYLDPISQMLGWNASTGQWTNPNDWSSFWGSSQDPNSWAGRYSGQQAGLDALLARIGAGPQTSDMQDAAGMIAQSYGYSPASWAALQSGMGDRLNASNVMGTAANTALGLQGSPFGQAQQQAMDIAMRQAEAAVGKQLESIFGARGGLAGFQAAYDMTSQLQNSYLQQQSQYNLALLDRSLAAVNAENQYYQELVNKGAIQAQDYLRFRWDALQTGYQDYAVAMDQTLRNAQSLYGTEQQSLMDYINSVTAAMAQEMGLSDWNLQNIQGWYDFWSLLMTDYDAAAGGTSSGGTSGYPPGSTGTLSGGQPPEDRSGWTAPADRNVGSDYGDLRGGGGAL